MERPYENLFNEDLEDSRYAQRQLSDINPGEAHQTAQVASHPQYVPQPGNHTGTASNSFLSVIKEDNRAYYAHTRIGSGIWKAAWPLLLMFGAEFAFTIIVVVFGFVFGFYTLQNLDAIYNDIIIIEALVQACTLGAIIPLYLADKRRRNPIYDKSTQSGKLMFFGTSFNITTVMISQLIILFATVITYYIGLDSASSSASEMIEEGLSTSPSVIINVISIAILPAFLEEILFRGIIFNRLLSFMPTGWAILVSGIIFGVSHGNVSQGVFAALFGCALAYTYLKTGSLIPGIIAHAFNNGLAVLEYHCDISVLGEIGIISTIAIIFLLPAILFLRTAPARKTKNPQCDRYASPPREPAYPYQGYPQPQYAYPCSPQPYYPPQQYAYQPVPSSYAPPQYGYPAQVPQYGQQFAYPQPYPQYPGYMQTPVPPQNPPASGNMVWHNPTQGYYPPPVPQYNAVLSNTRYAAPVGQHPPMNQTPYQPQAQSYPNANACSSMNEPASVSKQVPQETENDILE